MLTKLTKKLISTPGKVVNRALFYSARAADPQNRPIFRLEQTCSCHIPFERKFSAESHFPYPKTPNKPREQNMHGKSSQFLTFLIKN